MNDSDREDLDDASFEEVLRTRLAETAQLMPLDGRVWAEPLTNRPEGRGVWFAGAAASLLLLVGGLFALTNQTSAPDEAAGMINTDVAATVIYYTYPSSPDPQLAGEFADLYTDDEDWIPNAAAMRLNDRTEAEQSFTIEDRKLSLSAAFDLVRDAEVRDPGEVIDDLLRLRSGGLTIGGVVLEGDDRSTLAFELLTDLIATGRATPDQAAGIAALLESLPSVTTAANTAGSVTVLHSVETTGLLTPLRDARFTFDAATGHPVQMQSNNEQSYRIDYLSIERLQPGEYTVVDAEVTPSPIDEGP